MCPCFSQHKLSLIHIYLENKAGWDAQAKKVVYTGPIDAYFGSCYGPLEYRSVRFETCLLYTSGKSTLVRCLNLLHRPTTGEIWFEDSNIGELGKKELLDYRRRKISMVFQNFGLMNHRSVMGNVAFGLDIRGVPTIEREKKAMEMIEMVGLPAGACRRKGW